MYWTTQVGANTGKKLAFQADGNLVIYNGADQALWSPHTNGQGVTQLLLDGCAFSLVAGSSVKFTRGSSTCSQTSLSSAWSLPASGSTILLRSTEATLEWQADGNLVLYTLGGAVLWSSGTAGTGKTLSFQGDGNLVVYGSSSALWASGTNVSGSPAYTLQLGDKCTLAIKDGSTAKWTGISSCTVVSYSFSRDDGNSTFGATLRSELTTENTGTARLETTTAIDLTIFSHQIELVSATTYQTESDDGSDLENKSITIHGETSASANKTYEKTFFEHEKTFIIGFVPVTVTAGATGEIGIGLSYASGKLTLTPSATIYATLEAGVGAESDIAGAAAGIRGTLTIIEVALPITLEVYIANGQPRFMARGTLELDSLSGSIELYAEAYVKVLGIKVGVDWSKTLFSWDGVSWSKELFSKTGGF